MRSKIQALQMLRTFFPIARRKFYQVLCCGLAMLLSANLYAQQPASGSMRSNLVTANNEFAIALLREIESASAGKNLFVSPFSIESALMMTAEGARGETAAEMGKALRFPNKLRTEDVARPWDLATLRLELQGIYQRATSGDGYELQIANAIWAEKTLPINPVFVDLVSSFYGTSGAFAVDFKGQPEAQREAINDWVSDQTHEKINDVIPLGLIDEKTRMVLANAIYFNGTWSQPFDESLTKIEQFTTRDKGQMQAPLMSLQSSKTGRYGAFRSDGSPFVTPTMVANQSDEQAGYPGAGGFQIIELPYSGDRISMLILLPQMPDELDKLSALLSADRLNQWDQSLSRREFHIKLPKFKLETNYSLQAPLASLGMVRAFDQRPGVADFSGLCDSREPNQQLYISAVLHKAFVEVNEQGTEAAAATVVIISPTGFALGRPFVPNFIADHPFLFLIRDRQSGVILFIGKVEAP